MTFPADVLAYHDALSPSDREIADALSSAIERTLPDATNKVWHRHPVWFLAGNPIVGYDRLKRGMRLMFWSGQSFATTGLAASGTFQAAEIIYTSVDDLDLAAVTAWLEESREIQWDYEHIRTHRGLVKRTAF